MKLTIAEIREVYRKAEDKEAAIKQLMESEGASEKLIRCYVHGATGPTRESESSKVEPVKEKKRGRPAKTLNLGEDVKLAKAKKKPAKLKGRVPAVENAEFTKAIEGMTAEPDPVVEEPAMMLLGKEVKNFDDVTRIMVEAKAAKETQSHPVPATHEEVEMFYADIEDDHASFDVKAAAADNTKIMDSFEASVKERIAIDAIPTIKPDFRGGIMGFGSSRTLFDAATLSARIADNMRSIPCPYEMPELEPREKWEDKRKASVMHALFKRLKDVKSLPAEWVEEWNERCSNG